MGIEAETPQFTGLDFGNLLDGSATGNIQFFTTVIFIGIMTFGLYRIIVGVVKIIGAYSNDEQLTEGSDILKRVFWGVIFFFLGIVGLVLISSFFGNETPLLNNIDLTL